MQHDAPEGTDPALAEALARLAGATDASALARLAEEFLGKIGPVGQRLAAIPTLPPAERKDAGQAANRLKRGIEEAVAARKLALEEAALAADRSGAGFDPTLPAARPRRGALHPITRVTRELEDLFTSMGWLVLDGPEVELEHYNFDALNIPRDHPARDTMDTFRCDGEGKLVMRTHTSPVQVRAMERLKPPFRAIVPGKVFRNETVDASHEHTFHQVEGLAIDRDLSVGHLIGAMKTLLRGIFGKDLEVRLRPGYFPVVEPGVELEARCPGCKSGCSVCRRATWIERLPGGRGPPEVL
jgi:phenylalanyl-tRNA synthetase alpha chain